MTSRVVALSLFNNLFFNTAKILKIIMFQWILFIIYKKKKDFKKNEKELNKFGFNLNFIKETLSSYNYNYFDKNLSWQYHIFTAISEKKRKNFIDLRNSNLNNSNIFFYEMDSIELLDNFNKKSFDLIWIDGNHLNPQCMIDLFTSQHLLKDKGLMLCDDVIKFKYKGNYTSNESFQNLNFLENKKKCKNFFFIKRCNRFNAIGKKFISLSYKL